MQESNNKSVSAQDILSNERTTESLLQCSAYLENAPLLVERNVPKLSHAFSCSKKTFPGGYQSL